VQGGTAFTSTLSAAPTADRTLTLPDRTSTLATLGGDQSFTGFATFDLGPIVGAGYYLRFAVPSGGELHLQCANFSAGTALTLPAAGADTVAVLAYPQTFQRKTWAPLTVAAINALAAPSEGEVAYASDGRKPGEGAGAGTGVPAFYDGAAWFSFCDGQALAA